MASSVLPTAVGPTIRTRGSLFLSLVGSGIRGKGLDRILKMGDFRFHSYFALYRNYINLPMINGILRRIMLGAGKHMRLLSQADRFLGKSHLIRCPRLDFNENINVSLFCDDVYLAIGSPGISRNNLIAAF